MAPKDLSPHVAGVVSLNDSKPRHASFGGSRAADYVTVSTTTAAALLYYKLQSYTVKLQQRR
jgi:hypothetical protein